MQIISGINLGLRTQTHTYTHTHTRYAYHMCVQTRSEKVLIEFNLSFKSNMLLILFDVPSNSCLNPGHISQSSMTLNCNLSSLFMHCLLFSLSLFLSLSPLHCLWGVLINGSGMRKIHCFREFRLRLLQFSVRFMRAPLGSAYE